MCVFVLPSCVGTVGVNNLDETLASVPTTVVAPVRAGSDGALAISYTEDVWEWFGVTVPVERDFWSGHALKTAMRFLLHKYIGGGSVNLRVSSWGEDHMLDKWIHGFGVTHTVLEFDEVETGGGFVTVKLVSLGMFVWACFCLGMFFFAEWAVFCA